MNNNTALDDCNAAAGENRPRISFAIPVRNGARYIGRALDSLLAQDFDDFEVVICDNASTDGTGDIVDRYIERDPRIRCTRNAEDIGQIENFNRVFELSRGDYFRWMGADDWLEPAYARKCAAALDARSDAVGVTTQWRYMDDAGHIEFIDVAGPRVDAPNPFQRLCRALLLLQTPPALLFDPIYSMVRRNSLQQTALLPVNAWTDRLLAVELCLLGPFCHLDDCLSTRRADFERWKVRLPRYSKHLKIKRGHRVMLYVGFAAIVRRVPLKNWQKISCWFAILYYWIRDDTRRRVKRIAERIKRRVRPN
jgi:glycosyltransferase involved in cell wall biosynthesis